MAPGSSTPNPCEHKLLTYLCSPHFGFTNYKPASTPELQAAASSEKAGSRPDRPQVSEDELPNKHSWSFPAPLVLPQAALEDPDSEPQSYGDWCIEHHRNSVTSKRRTLYVCAAPSISSEVESAHRVSRWTAPKVHNDTVRDLCEPPKVTDVASYLSAFYHGLPVKVLDAGLKFIPWADEPLENRAARKQRDLHIGLATSQECVRIRTRAVKDSMFERQLHLNDLLDVVMSILPKDAYSLLMLVNHDSYESEDDDFCCGRAYGGSRIAVVSTARYNPVLDESDGLDHQHAWPGSHCLDFVLNQCESVGCEHLAPAKKKVKRRKAPTQPTCDLLELQPAETPLHKAVAAQFASAAVDQSPHELWLARVCKTASHEFGHCFGLDHCEYYACIMQSTSSCAEDAEQPPYLCPVDQRKVLSATGQGLADTYKALRNFCETRHGCQMWAAFAAWLTARIAELPVTPRSNARAGDRMQPIVLE